MRSGPGMQTSPTPHLDADTLAAYVDGRLLENDLSEADRHIDSCRSCRLELSTLAAIHTVPRTSLGDAPEGTLGRYHILRELGRGSMGIVLRAFDPELARPVAIKLVRDLDDTMRELLRREARALAKLRHPHVVTVYDVMIEAQAIYVAMELVEGDTLRGYCKGKTTHEILEACVRAGKGLAAAHDAGVIHRDFKPENVLCGDHGEVKVSDFGLARVADEEVDGALCGTPGYMAPEVIDRKPATAASDQYSFCVSVFELLAGERPTRGGPKSSVAFPQIPTWVLRVLRRGLEPDPAARHPSMHALVTALADDPRSRRRRRIALAAGAAIAVATGALIVQITSPKEAASCAIDESALGGAWNAEQRAALTASLTRASDVETASRVVAGIDRYTARWLDARRKTCVAGRGDDNEIISRRLACLELRRLTVRDIVDDWREASPVEAASAPDGVGRLLDPDGCERPSEKFPDEVSGRVIVWQAYTISNRANGLRYRGRTDESDALAKAAISLLDGLPESVAPLVRAEALFTRAQNEIDRGHPERAEELLFEALKSAEQARDDVLTATLWVEIVGITGAQRHRFDLAASNARAADAALARIEPGPQLRLRYAYTWGSILTMNGKLDEARKRLQAGLAVGSAHHNGTPQIGQVQIALCDLERLAGNIAKARELCTAGLKSLEEALGPNHVRVAIMRTTLGAVEFGARDLEAGEATFKQAVATFEKRGATQHIAYAVALANLGAVRSEGDDMESARQWYTRSLAVFDAHHPKHPQRMLALRGLANIALRTGDTAGAIPLYLKIRLARAETYPREHPERLAADYNLALAYQSNKQLDEAAAIVNEMTKNALMPGKEQWMLGARALDLSATMASDKKDYAKALALRGRALVALSHIPPSIENAYLLVRTGETYLGMKKPVKAIGPLEDAVALFVEYRGDAYDLGTTRFALARAYVDTNRNRTKVPALLRQAADDLARAKTGSGLAAHRANVARYLEKYGT